MALWFSSICLNCALCYLVRQVCPHQTTGYRYTSEIGQTCMSCERQFSELATDALTCTGSCSGSSQRPQGGPRQRGWGYCGFVQSLPKNTEGPVRQVLQFILSGSASCSLETLQTRVWQRASISHFKDSTTFAALLLGFFEGVCQDPVTAGRDWAIEVSQEAFPRYADFTLSVASGFW